MDLLLEGVSHGLSASGPLSPRPPLPKRQAQVLEMHRGGLSTREIADRLGVTLKTVQTHLFRAKRQLLRN